MPEIVNEKPKVREPFLGKRPPLKNIHSNPLPCKDLPHSTRARFSRRVLPIGASQTGRRDMVLSSACVLQRRLLSSARCAFTVRGMYGLHRWPTFISLSPSKLRKGTCKGQSTKTKANATAKAKTNTRAEPKADAEARDIALGLRHCLRAARLMKSKGARWSD